MMIQEKSTLILSNPVSELRGIGPRYLKYLEKLGIKTIKDLLFYFPFRYDDFSKIKKISEIKVGEIVTIIGQIQKIKNRYLFRRRLTLTEAKISDETGELDVIWFNQPYLLKNLALGATVSLSGKISAKKKKLILASPAYELISEPLTESKSYILQKKLRNTGRLVPIYPLTSGLTSRLMRYFITMAIKLRNQIEDPLPYNLRKKYQLTEIKEALKQIHFPDDFKKAQLARARFIFEELFLLQLYFIKRKAKYSHLKAPQINLDIPLVQEFVKKLPFTLTDGQRQVIWQIINDLSSLKPMNRLLEGEVGSGKTIVAMVAALLAVKSGYQVAFLAPTELLAQQHFDRFSNFLNGFGIKICLLTSSETRLKEDELEGKVSKKIIKKIIEEGRPMIVIGTHALIQKDVRFKNLGLLIVDEQHRFGVEQRASLVLASRKEKGDYYIPHLLSMTATPIPRTLALTLYGDLDLSLLTEVPSGRQPIYSEIVLPERQKEIFEFIRQEVKKGRQVFVICPRIEEPTEEAWVPDSLLDWNQKINSEVKAVKKEYQKLSQEIYPDLKVGMLHGKMKSAEKEKIMQDFRDKKIDILVTTSVVEVGIDIANATIMVIEGAERFGLAQLHQFRGRVGRGSYQSYCFLFPSDNNQAESLRLKALVNCQDGFKLSEEDLKIRGPGEFIGTRQAGYPDLAMAKLSDLERVSIIREEALKLYRSSPALKEYPLLARRFEEFEKTLRNL